MTIQDIFQLLSNPLFFAGLALFVFVICAIALAWCQGYKTAMVEVLALLDGAHPAKLSPSVHHPDYYGDPWTEGLTAESKESRIDTL